MLKKKVSPIAQEDLILRKSMLLPFHGSVLYGIELDSLSSHTEIAIEKFTKDIQEAKRPSTPSGIIIHLNGTLVPKEFVALIAENICQAPEQIRRCAFVGLDWHEKRAMNAALRDLGCKAQYAYFSDYEKAKEWVIP